MTGNLSLSEFDDLIDILKMGSACGLGPSAGLIAQHLSLHFGDHLHAHVLSGICPAGVCGRLG